MQEPEWDETTIQRETIIYARTQYGTAEQAGSFIWIVDQMAYGKAEARDGFCRNSYSDYVELGKPTTVYCSFELDESGHVPTEFEVAVEAFGGIPNANEYAADIYRLALLGMD